MSPAATPTLWRLAGQGSVGSLVDYAVPPLSLPGRRLAHAERGRPRAVRPHRRRLRRVPRRGREGAGAEVPGLPALESYNQQFHNNPDWGTLAGAACCATAVGPGAALALADRSGHVASYLPSPSQPHRRGAVPLPADRRGPGNTGYLPNERRCLPPRTPNSPASWRSCPPALPCSSPRPASTASRRTSSWSWSTGPGTGPGLLDASSTRQPGLVVLTDLTPTVLGWLGRAGAARRGRRADHPR